MAEDTHIGLIHAKWIWPGAIKTYLWPNAMHTTNEVNNYTPSQNTGKVLIQNFSQLKSNTVMRHFHTFASQTKYWTLYINIYI